MRGKIYFRSQSTPKSTPTPNTDKNCVRIAKRPWRSFSVESSTSFLYVEYGAGLSPPLSAVAEEVGNCAVYRVDSAGLFRFEKTVPSFKGPRGGEGSPRWARRSRRLFYSPFLLFLFDIYIYIYIYLLEHVGLLVLVSEE